MIAVQLLLMAGPLALAGLTEQLLGLLDAAIVGRIGTAAFGAVSVAGGIFVVPATLVVGLVMGLRILAAREFGNNGSASYGAVVRSCALPPLLAGVGLAVTVSPLAALFTHLVAPAISPNTAAAYLAVRALSLPLVALTASITAAFACAGDSRLSMRLVLAVNAVHIPLACVLGLGWIDGRAYGVLGVAASSLLADAVGCFAALFHAYRRRDLGIVAGFDVDLRVAARAARLGWPESINLCTLVAVEPCTIAMLAPGGAVIVAAYRALAMINDACNVLSFSVSEAAQILVSQALGSRSAGQAPFRVGLLLCTAAGCAVALLVAPLSADAVSLVSASAAVGAVAAVPVALHIALTHPLKGFAVGCEARLYAEGHTRFIMTFGILAAALALSLVWVGVRLGFGLLSLPVAWTVAWCLRAGVFRWRIALEDRRSAQRQPIYGRSRRRDGAYQGRSARKQRAALIMGCAPRTAIASESMRDG